MARSGNRSVESSVARLSTDLLALAEKVSTSAVEEGTAEMRDEIKRLSRRQETLERKLDDLTSLTAELTRVLSESAELPKGKKIPSLCKHPGCAKPVRARGYCMNHYQLWRRGRLKTEEE